MRDSVGALHRKGRETAKQDIAQEVSFGFAIHFPLCTAMVFSMTHPCDLSPGRERRRIKENVKEDVNDDSMTP